MLKWIRRLLSIISTVFVGLVLLISLLNLFSAPEGPAFLGHKGYTVISASMEPALKVGDYIVVQIDGYDELLEKGVISFENGASIVTHRIEKVMPDGSLVTRGDANQTDDLLAVTKEEYIGTLRWRIPFLGQVMIWLQNPLIFSLIMAVIATRLVVLIIFKK